MEEDRSVVINSIIGMGTSYNGDIESVDLLRIDGNFSGIAKSLDVVLIGEQGRVKGTLFAPRVIIAGSFQGKIENCDLVILQSSAVILGNLEVKNVIVEPGAIICGSLRTIYNKHNTSNFEEQDLQIRHVGKFSSKMLEKLFST